MVNSEERKRLDDFFGLETSAELLLSAEQKNMPVYNVCPWQGMINNIDRSGLWFRFYRPGAQLKFVVSEEPDGAYQITHLKSRFGNNNPTKIVFGISSLIDFVLTEAG